jgi:hypothetical protein
MENFERLSNNVLVRTCNCGIVFETYDPKKVCHSNKCMSSCIKKRKKNTIVQRLKLKRKKLNRQSFFWILFYLYSRSQCLCWRLFKLTSLKDWLRSNFYSLLLNVKMSATNFTNICFKSEKMIIEYPIWFVIFFATARTLNQLSTSTFGYSRLT